MDIKDKFKKIERDFTPLYRAHHGEYQDGHYNVKNYWSASVEGVPEYDAFSTTGASLKWCCSITGAWTPLAQWMCDTLDEAFASLEKEITEQKPRKYWVGP
jgi:hypothetical protein